MLNALISTISPAWALKREQSRLALGRVRDLQARMAYEGARVTRRTRGWQASATSANVETMLALQTLRDRSRDLVRNNPYAAAGLDMAVSYQVGTGIVPRSDTGDKTADMAANALWEQWGRQADGTGRHDINGLMAQAARTRCEAGEALVLMEPIGAAEARARNLAVPLLLKVLEPDHLDGYQNNWMAPNDAIIQGVEMDGRGRPIFYHIYPNHPGDLQSISQPVRIPANVLLHIYRQDRPGQVRGVPDLAPVMTRLRMIDEYEDAALMQALSQACVAAFVTSGAAEGTGPLEAGAGSTDGIKTLKPGMIERLMPGEQVDFLTPSGSGAFSDFTRHQLRAVATGFGLTYDLLTGDLSQANYSSLRAGRLAFKRRLETLQWQLLVPRLCQPIWEAFIRSAVVAGRLPPIRGEWKVKWSTPRFEMVDPYKDTMAIREQLRLGIMTWGQAVAEAGEDPEQQVTEIAKWNDLHDESGLILDGDPRRVSAGGAAQDAAQNAAVEIAATGAASPGSALTN